MSNDLSPSQMRAMAQALSDMGRGGDTQLVHVMPEEVELLKKIGGRGTRNPATGLLEFNTPNTDWIDQWNSTEGLDDKYKIDKSTAGSSSTISGTNTDGTTYSFNNSTSDTDDDWRNGSGSLLTTDPATGQTVGVSEAANGGEAGVAGRGPLTEAERAANRKSNPFDLDGDGSMWTSTDRFGATKNIFGQTVNITDKNSGGYIWNAMDADGDGSMFTAKNNSYGTNSLVQGKNTFSTVANVAALVSNPVAYLGGKVINNLFDKDGDGSMFTRGGVMFNPDGGGDDGNTRTNSGVVGSITDSGGSSGSNNTSETGAVEVDETGATDEGETYSSIVGNYNYNGFSNRNDGRKYLDYTYTDGAGTLTGSHIDQVRPFHISMSMDDAASYAFSEQAANSVEQMISQLPPELMKQMSGAVNVYMTKDQKIAVIMGNEETGFVEALYDGSQDGATNAMNDIANMMAYVEATGDTDIDAGFMGRVASAERFQGYGTETLRATLAQVRAERESYEPNTPPYIMATERIDELLREIARRENAAEAHTGEYSAAGVTTVVGETAAQNVGS